MIMKGLLGCLTFSLENWEMRHVDALSKYERQLQGMIRLLLHERVVSFYIYYIYEQATQILEEDTLAGLSLSQI